MACEHTKLTIDKNENKYKTELICTETGDLEYIPRLATCWKWVQQTNNFKIGDSVIIKLKYVPRNHWPLGQVI